jgi:ABC-type arginine/histidine transport system permease subunit
VGSSSITRVYEIRFLALYIDASGAEDSYASFNQRTYIYITKFSFIAYFVTLPELVYVSEVIGAKTFAYTEVYIVAACLYIAVAFVISEFMEYLYKKLSIQGLTMM